MVQTDCTINILQLSFFGSGQEENRTPMTARSPHFECGASTSFATRPFIQLSYNTLFSHFATTNLKNNNRAYILVFMA